MPNNITTIIHIESAYNDEDQLDYEEKQAKITDLWKRLHTEESKFDFNAIIPQPKDIYRGELTAEDHIKHPVNWYDWNIENWGTKWNSYDVVYLDGTDLDAIFGEILVKIETAWSPPTPVLGALSKDFNVRYTWKDEGDDEWHNWSTIQYIEVENTVGFTNE